jgi:hypothetical protein
MEFEQEARGPGGAAHWQFSAFSHLDEDELEEILSAGVSLPQVEHTLRRILEMEVAEDDNIFS